MKAQLEKIPFSQTAWICRKFSLTRFNYPWHFHPELELTLILSSHGTRFVGDKIDSFKEGDLVLLGADLPHVWLNDQDHKGKSESLVLQFRQEFLSPLILPEKEYTLINQTIQMARRGLKLKGELRNRVETDLKKMMKEEGIGRLCLLLGILEKISKSREYDLIASAGYEPLLNGEDGLRLNKIFQFLHNRFREEVFEKETAILVGMSPSAFSRYFKKRTGTTFASFLIDMRLSHACKLLVESDRTIAEICFDSGFLNLSNFNRQFLRRKKCSPKVYRQHTTGLDIGVGVPEN
ncbi:MAG: AraC family transcriptional regulator [Verrucomicrobiota bacterium]|nr:AraC family transcriptional regulator [Verrucomicrobiota bacterium]